VRKGKEEERKKEKEMEKKKTTVRAYHLVVVSITDLVVVNITNRYNVLLVPSILTNQMATLFVWFICHQPALSEQENKPTTSNQNQDHTSHQLNEPVLKL
jgi:hypothetical protein